MAKTGSSWTIEELAHMVGGEVIGESAREITVAVPAGTTNRHGIAFARDAKHLELALSVELGAIVAPTGSDLGAHSGILVKNPRLAFARILALFEPKFETLPGIHPSAVVAEGAVVSPQAHIGAHCTIGDDVVIEAGATIHALCSIGPNCLIGQGSTLMPRVTLVGNTTLGKNCVLHSGVVIGSEGFGFEPTAEGIVKVPQVGGVVLGDFVEIGANTCVDRGAMSDTVVGSNSKIDNLCQIGHNVEIGENCLIAGMTGIAGSVCIGSNVMIGANCGIKDHVRIASGTILAGRTSILADIDKPGTYLGAPAMPLRSALRSYSLLTRLPELYQRLKAVESAVGGDS